MPILLATDSNYFDGDTLPAGITLPADATQILVLVSPLVPVSRETVLVRVRAFLTSVNGDAGSTISLQICDANDPTNVFGSPWFIDNAVQQEQSGVVAYNELDANVENVQFGLSAQLQGSTTDCLIIAAAIDIDVIG